MITDSRELKSYHVIIGVDQGYGNIKTANTCFKAGVTVYDKDPYFKGDMVFYGGKYYVIGEQHKTFIKDKDEDEDYYGVLPGCSIFSTARSESGSLPTSFASNSRPSCRVARKKSCPLTIW